LASIASLKVTSIYIYKWSTTIDKPFLAPIQTQIEGPKPWLQCGLRLINFNLHCCFNKHSPQLCSIIIYQTVLLLPIFFKNVHCNLFCSTSPLGGYSNDVWSSDIINNFIRCHSPNISKLISYNFGNPFLVCILVNKNSATIMGIKQGLDWKVWLPPTLLHKIRNPHFLLQMALTRTSSFLVNLTSLSFNTECSIRACLNYFKEQNSIPSMNLNSLHISLPLNIGYFLPPSPSTISISLSSSSVL